MKRVYLFAEGNKSMINLLGGKGGNLAEMKKIGLPIPEGIIISTEACKEYYGNGELLSEELKNEVLEQINKLEEMTGKKFEGEKTIACFSKVWSTCVYAWNDGYYIKSRYE